MKRGNNFTFVVISSLMFFFVLLTINLVSADITINGSGNFATISEAIGNASSGNVIELSNGTYFENVTINKRITLKSRDGADITELEGSITIDFDDVKVSELTVSNPSGAYAIFVSSTSDDALIENNIVRDVGTTTAEDHVQAIYIVGGDDHVVKNNTIHNIVSSSLSGSSKGIFAGGSSGTTSDLKILNNTIFDVNSARGAYGILINRDSTRLEISGNEIYDVTGGLWAHAISLDADTFNAIVKENNIYDVLGTFLGFGVSVNVEENEEAETIKIFNNSLLSGVGVLNQMNLSEVDAENNWWGACNGPSGFDNAGSGSASVGTPFGDVDFEPWIGTCVEEKAVDPICSIASNNLTLIANVTSNLCIGDVIFGVVINGSEMNFTGIPSLSGIGNYEFEVDKSLLEGGLLDWNVYAEDCYGHLNWTSLEQKYVFSETKISVSPSEPNGQNGWYVSEPLFTLTNSDANSTNMTIYKWDSGPEYNYTSPFGLENITNFPPISAGILDVRYRSDICEEPFQVLDIKVDLVAPQFIDLKPVDGANLTKNNVEVKVYIDEVFQSNSGINVSTIILKVDDFVVSPTINSVGIDAQVKFNATNLSNGKHNISISAEDKAGNFNSTTWEFNISSKPIFDIDLNLPNASTFNNRRVQVNITSDTEFDKISYIDFAEDNPRERILCRSNCENFGNDKARFVTFKDGFRNLTFIGENSDGETDNESISFIVDSKKPRILKSEPKRGFTNGSFSVEVDEENIDELIINYGNNNTGFRFEKVNVNSNKTPIAVWHFDEGIGSNIFDSTPNNNDGTIEGATWTNDSISGTALFFDGINDRIDVPKTPSMDVTESVVLEVYIKRSSDQDGTIFSRNGPFFIAVKDDKLYGGIHTSGGPEGYTHIQGTSILEVGEWYHLKITYDGNSVKGYVNGVEEAGAPKSGIMVVRSQQPWIGWGEPGHDKYFHGIIDELIVSEGTEGQCSEGRRGQECFIEVNLSDYDGEVVLAWFNVTDIVGNSAVSRQNEVEADTTLPILNSFNYTVDGRRVNFVFNVTELNFDEINYRDNNGTLEKSICSRLKGEICERRISFREGDHNISILIKDEAGNSINESANFFIN